MVSATRAAARANIGAIVVPLSCGWLAEVSVEVRVMVDGWRVEVAVSV